MLHEFFLHYFMSIIVFWLSQWRIVSKSWRKIVPNIRMNLLRVCSLSTNGTLVNSYVSLLCIRYLHHLFHSHVLTKYIKRKLKFHWWPKLWLIITKRTLINQKSSLLHTVCARTIRISFDLMHQEKKFWNAQASHKLERPYVEWWQVSD